MARNRVDATAIAVSLGITPAALRRKLSGERQFTINDLGQVAGALGLGPWDLLMPPRRWETGIPNENRDPITGIPVSLVAGRGFEPPTSGL